MSRRIRSLTLLDRMWLQLEWSSSTPHHRAQSRLGHGKYTITLLSDKRMECELPRGSTGHSSGSQSLRTYVYLMASWIGLG